ncbi:MAG TPA: serine hydrolase [Bacteroidota bacterium]|nr:serine hydrolase [Bacteroidota bacterium]
MNRIGSLIGIILLVAGISFAQSPTEIERQISDAAGFFGGRIGVCAKDLNSNRIIEVNADSLFPTASTIKLPVLVELFYQFNEKRLAPDKPIALLDSVKKPGSGILQFLHSGQTLKLIDIATMMIILSDNTATNYVIDQLGTDHEAKLDVVNSRMRSLGLQHTKLLNKLYSWETKKKTEEARRFGIGVTSPGDMALLIEKIARRELIDSAASDSIIQILKAQQDITQAARLLPFAEDSTLWIANKTGSLDEVKNDIGIISSSKRTFVYAIYCDGSKDIGEQVDNKATIACANVARVLYDYFIGGIR